MNRQNKKTMIIVHGGATKAAFAAGAVYGLSKIGIKAADIILGTSSSVPTMAYFAGKQFDDIKDIWKNEIGNKQLIKYGHLFTGEPVFDLNYLIHSVFQKKHPLNAKNIIKSKSLFIVPLYNYRTGEVETQNNRQKNFQKIFWPILKAAMTIHDEHLAQNNEFRDFVDADLDPFAIYRQGLLPQAGNILIIINHKMLGVGFTKLLGLKLFRLLQSKNFPEGVKNKLKIRNALIKSGIKNFKRFLRKTKALVISPPENAKMNVFSLIQRKDKKLKQLFDIGQRAAISFSEKNKQTVQAFIERSGQLS